MSGIICGIELCEAFFEFQHFSFQLVYQVAMFFTAGIGDFDIAENLTGRKDKTAYMLYGDFYSRAWFILTTCRHGIFGSTRFRLQSLDTFFPGVLYIGKL